MLAKKANIHTIIINILAQNRVSPTNTKEKVVSVRTKVVLADVFHFVMFMYVLYVAHRLQQCLSSLQISRSTGALLNSSWQQQRQHRMRPLLTSASTNVSLDAMSDDALDRSVRITTLSF